MSTNRQLSGRRQPGQRRGGLLSIVAGCAVAVLLSFVTIYLGSFSFTTADEAWLAQALAGSFSGKPASWVPYLSAILTRALALLYGGAPGVPWYALFQAGSITLGMAVINGCIFSRLRARFARNTLIPGLIVCVLADIPLCWTLSHLNLYHVAAVTGAAALCLLTTVGPGSRRFVGAGALTALLFFICVSCAPAVAAALFCCALAVSAYRFAVAGGGTRRSRAAVRGGALLLVMAVLLAGTLAVARIGQNSRGDERYQEWSALRGAYLSAAPGAYDQDDAPYKRAGWSRALAELTGRGYLMDKQFNAKAVSRLLDGEEAGALTSWEALVLRAGQNVDASRSNGQVLGLAVLLHGVCLIAIVLCLRKGQPALRAAGPVGCVLLADLLLVWLSRKGWLNHESAFIVGIPCLMAALLSLVDGVCGAIRDFRAQMGDTDALARQYGGMALVAAAGAVVIAGGICMYVFNNHMGFVPAASGEAATFVEVEPANQTETLEDDGADEAEEEDAKAAENPSIYEYLSAHRFELFVCDEAALASVNAVQASRAGALSNLFCWDGAYRYSLPYEEQLAANGLEAPLSSADFRRDDVRFIASSPDDIRLLLQHLSDACGLDACTVQAELEGGLRVVRFLKKYDIDDPEPAAGAPLGVLLCEDGEVSEYLALTREGGDMVQWVAPNEFVVAYHLTEEDAAAEKTTRVPYGSETATLTCRELDFFREGYSFLGWRAYRSDSRCWLVRDEDGIVRWTRRKPVKSSDFLQYGEGAALSVIVEPGVVMHLYAVWQKTDAYTVNYHLSDDAPVAEKTKVTPGNRVKLKAWEDMTGFETGKRFAGWRAYRTDKRGWQVVDAEGGLSWAKKKPLGGKYWLYEDEEALEEEIPAGAELHLYAQWKKTDSFTVYYHIDENADTAAETEVKFGTLTKLLTYQELGFDREGVRFLGWRVYREDTECWLKKDRQSGKTSWVKNPKDEDYMLWADGHSVSQAVPAGAELHLYAQWEDTDAFTVRYHSDDNAAASARTTEVPYGEPTRTLTPEELGFYRAGKRFAGWKMYRSDMDAWGVVDANGVGGWAGEPPRDGGYWLYQAGWAVSEAVPAGYELHLYAQWEDTDEFIVYYHEGDAARPDDIAEVLRLGASTPTQAPMELGFDLEGRRFEGWRLYREDTRCWWVADASGREAWAQALPEGGEYALAGSGAVLDKLVDAGAAVHLYAQWVDSFTVYYHLNDDSPASEITTQALYGESTPVESVRDLGFAQPDRQFAGWRVYRTDTRCWLLLDGNGQETWAEKPQEGWRYGLYRDGVELSTTAQPGAEVHLYAQWK